MLNIKIAQKPAMTSDSAHVEQLILYVMQDPPSPSIDYHERTMGFGQ